MEQVIVCAAMRHKDVIVCGARHFDTHMLSQINAMNLHTTEWEQGFIDQFGHFLTRKEAWKIADKMGQIRRPTGWETSNQPRVANVGDEEIGRAHV